VEINMKRFAHCLLLALAVALPAHGQQWPSSGPVSLLVANSPGSSPDAISRMVAAWMSKAFSQQFIVLNRPGANAIPASLAAARAKADGYTLFVAGSSTMTRNLSLLKSLPYHPERDFTPVATIVDSVPIVLVVNPAIPVSSVRELIAYAKANPKKISYSASGGLSPIVGELLSKRAGIQLIQVRYKETPLAIHDTVSGVVAATLMTLPDIEGLAKSGKLRVLAVVARERFPVMPDVPTVSETVPGVDQEGGFYLVGPAGLPSDIVQRLNREVDRFVKEPETQKRMHAYGFAARGAGTPEALAEFIRTENAEFGQVVQELGLARQ
jgi:tripartite-type tricarboxylate transporter receptor subunit TctC